MGAGWERWGRPAVERGGRGHGMVNTDRESALLRRVQEGVMGQARSVDVTLKVRGYAGSMSWLVYLRETEWIRGTRQLVRKPIKRMYPS